MKDGNDSLGAIDIRYGNLRVLFVENDYLVFISVTEAAVKKANTSIAGTPNE